MKHVFSVVITFCTFVLAMSAQNDLARVIKYGGIYVFSDCTPVASYEEIGKVNFAVSDGKRYALINGSTYGAPTQLSNGQPYGQTYATSTGTTGTYIAVPETPQYNEIRNGLVEKAYKSNPKVEGVVITTTGEGTGEATMIRFAKDVTDRDLARVNNHGGVLVYTDCLPVQSYTYLGEVRAPSLKTVDYTIIRDKLCKKGTSRYKTVQGLIPHFVTDSVSYAEAIIF